jgi:hypothetical protein
VFTHPAFGAIEKTVDVPVASETSAVPISVDFCDEGKPSATPMDNCGGAP